MASVTPSVGSRSIFPDGLVFVPKRGKKHLLALREALPEIPFRRCREGKRSHNTLPFFGCALGWYAPMPPCAALRYSSQALEPPVESTKPAQPRWKDCRVRSLRPSGTRTSPPQGWPPSPAADLQSATYDR